MPAPVRTRLSLAMLVAASVRCSRGDRSGVRETESAGPLLVGASRLSARGAAQSPPVLPPMCPEGMGDPEAACDGNVPGLHLDQVYAAVDELVEKQPELFDRDHVIGQDGYKVLSDDGFYLGVAGILQAKGVCAVWDYSQLDIKTSAATSEAYVLLDSKNFIRRGDRILTSTCVPAAFPLDPQDVVDRVRVGFYGIRCPDERKPPRNGEGL